MPPTECATGAGALVTDIPSTDLEPAASAAPALSIAFTREELVVLAELAQLRLPLLGDRPLGGVDPGVREVIVGSARRSLLARGIATRSDDGVEVARAAIGLLEIVAAGSLRVVVDQTDAQSTLVSRRLWFAVPYAAVEVWVDEDENYRFLPFATADLLMRVLQHTGVLDAADTAGEPISFAYAAWAAAAVAADVGRPLEALQELSDAGITGPAADALVATLERAKRRIGVQVVHHPTPTSTAGGEIAWVDAGAAGVWLAPTLDQPFATADVRTDGWFGNDVEPPSPDPDLAPVVITVSPIDRQAIADVLLSYLPLGD